MFILIFLSIFLIGCSDCSKKTNSPRNNIPVDPKHNIPVIPPVPPEDQTPLPIPDEPTTQPDKPKPPIPSENDKQKYEWIDITFADGTSYNSKIMTIAQVIFCVTIQGFIIEINDGNITVKHCDLDITGDKLIRTLRNKISPEYIKAPRLRIRFLKNEIKMDDWVCVLNLNSKVVSVDFSNIDVSHVKNMIYMFGGCRSLKSVYGLKNLNKSGDYCHMFYGCKSLNYIENVEQWNLDHSAKTTDMFKDCPLLKKPSWYKGN